MQSFWMVEVWLERKRKNASPRVGGILEMEGWVERLVLFWEGFWKGVKEERAGQMQARGFFVYSTPCNNRVPIAE